MEQNVICGNNIELLKSYPDNHFDAIVTDPPYGLGKEPNAEDMLREWLKSGYMEVKGGGFMGKEWDAFVPQPIFWKEVFRVLKPGGYVLAFYGTRTYDWGVMAMRLAGFEVRDSIQWIYGSGFPKSHNIGKAVDKLQGNDREVIGISKNDRPNSQVKGGRAFDKAFNNGQEHETINITKGNSEWEGWGSALKPAHEDLVLARKPFQFSSEFVSLYEELGYKLKLQLCQSKLFAKDVKEIFTLNQKESKKVELDFAQWSVEKPFNIKEDLLVLMDMLQLEMKEESTSLNIVLLWLNTLVELWNVVNIYTTETESSTITELRILNSLEWESIFQNITLVKDNKTNGLIANVLTVESLFSVLKLKLNDILTHSAKENVTLKESEKNFVPNSEPIVVCRKPLEKGLSIAENVLKWGVGGINIDGCRISHNEKQKFTNREQRKEGWNMDNCGFDSTKNITASASPDGRFPANIILECICDEVIKGEKGEPFNYKGKEYNNKDTSMFNGDKPEAPSNYNDKGDTHTNPDCPCYIMDRQSGESKSSKGINQGRKNGVHEYGFKGIEQFEFGYNDKGGASRFFYQAKASKSERNRGLEGFEERNSQHDFGTKLGVKRSERVHTPKQNFHPTVKPVKLMQYLVRLVTPPNGLVLDPFCGSGTTGIACRLEGFNFVGMEREEDYAKIAQARIDNWFGASDKDSVPESSSLVESASAEDSASARLEPPKEIPTQLKFNF